MKNRAWCIYYYNHGYEVFESREKMDQRINSVKEARKDAEWVAEVILTDMIKFDSEAAFERELTRFIKRGWNRFLEIQIATLGKLRNKPDMEKVKCLNWRRQVEELKNSLDK